MTRQKKTFLGLVGLAGASGLVLAYAWPKLQRRKQTPTVTATSRGAYVATNPRDPKAKRRIEFTLPGDERVAFDETILDKMILR